MPTRTEIHDEINEGAHPDFVRRKYLAALSKVTGNDTIIYFAGFGPKLIGLGLPSSLISIVPDDVQAFMSALNGLNGEHLDLVLQSGGGSLEAAEQLVNYLRAKYLRVRVIVPHQAMSAATMIACSCNSIVMGKHSALGPVDPQITLPNGAGSFQVPAQAVLDDFERAKREVADSPKVAPLWAAKFQSLPHGVLSMCQTVMDRSVEKVAEWLNSYMIEDLSKCKDIAKWLGDAGTHKSHGRPICLEVARSKGLVVEALEENPAFQDAVLSVFHASMLTLETTNCVKMVENHTGRGLYRQLNVAPRPQQTSPSS